MESALVKEILAWPEANAGCELPALISYLAGRLNDQRLNEIDVGNALVWLKARGLAKVEDGSLRLTEPDRPELQLYEPLERQLASRKFLTALEIVTGTFVLQDTSSGGKFGSGPLSRPDFTLAAMKYGRFDRALEVSTFEVKNRAGAGVASVYEAVAHSRVSHFPYLVIPRSRLELEKLEAIRRASEKEGIGLVLFDVVEDGLGSFTIQHFKLDLAPKRRHPERADTEKYLEQRLTASNQEKLEALLKGAVGG